MHMTNRSQCETEDSHKCLPKESLVPRVTVDRGSFAHDMYTDPMLIQRIRSAVDESSGAVNGVLENLVTSGLGEVLLKRDVGSVSRMLDNPAWVGQ